MYTQFLEIIYFVPKCFQKQPFHPLHSGTPCTALRLQMVQACVSYKLHLVSYFHKNTSTYFFFKFLTNSLNRKMHSFRVLVPTIAAILSQRSSRYCFRDSSKPMLPFLLLDFCPWPCFNLILFKVRRQ